MPSAVLREQTECINKPSHMHTDAHIDIQKNQVWFGGKSPDCVTVATVTLYVPVTAMEQWLLILNLICTQSKHPSSLSFCSPFSPSPCVNLFLHPYRSLHLPSPSPTSLFSRFISHSQCQIIGYSVQLTNMEWEDRRSLADNHTLSLSCFSPC